MGPGDPQALGNRQRFEKRGSLKLAPKTKPNNAIRWQPVDRLPRNRDEAR